MSARLSRRHMLKLMGLASASVGLGAWTRGAEAEPDGFVVRVDGEDNRVGHMIRDGYPFRIPLPSRSLDVVVVGGGVSGLTAAYKLRDNDALVLEKETKPGGHARRGTWKDISYSEGAAYISDTSGFVGDLIHELNVPLLEIPEPGDAYLVGRRAVSDYWGKGADRLPFSESARKGFKAFRTDVSGMRDLPPLPVEKASSAALRYDTLSFGEFVRPYGPEVHRYLDLYCRSALGGGVDQVSAYWGLNFLSGEFGSRYTAPGGNAVVGESLARAVGAERIQTGATVIRIEPKGDRVWVTYVHGDEVTTLESKAVVVAIAKQFSKYIVVGLPQDQRQAMAQVQYEPYLVANVLVNAPAPKDGYDTWTHQAPFTDFIVADWVNPVPGRNYSVLTAYCPLPYAERYRLLQDDQVRLMGRQVVSRLDAIYPGLARHVEEVRTYRRGHPMVLSSLGAVTRLRPLATRPFGAVFFANSDSQMTATIEAAIWEGLKSAEHVQETLRHGHRMLQKRL